MAKSHLVPGDDRIGLAVRIAFAGASLLAALVLLGLLPLPV